MSVQCPADGCGYQGTLDAVEGHIGGVADALHEEVVVPDLQAALAGSEGGGEGSEMPLWALVGLAVVVLVVAYRLSESDDQPEQEEQRERVTFGGGAGA